MHYWKKKYKDVNARINYGKQVWVVIKHLCNGFYHGYKYDEWTWEYYYFTDITI